MKKELASKYNPKNCEKGRYDWWVKNDFFTAGKDLTKIPFTIVIPPPNVTGTLHLGHAWENTIQDIVIRRKRMQGFDALYLPGTDHAGLATQAKIDAKLVDEGTSRYILGRNEYLKVAFDWKKQYAASIHSQWKALGLSLDYTKERFTLDESLSKAVNYVFISLYEKGLIYKDNRIINWDPDAKTALSNIEVEYVEQTSSLYYFCYPIVDSNESLVVATTRPETMFGDQAVMVNPNDKRYKKYIGKHVFIPGTNVKIPIIADDYVDIDFGSGVVKVTPAHDPNDFEVAKRHQLKMPLCMQEDGTMNQMAFEFEGLDRFECRKRLVDKLTKLGLVDKIQAYENSVGYSERTGVMVEPRLSLQWFVKMSPLAANALEKSHVEFIPDRFKKIFNHWLENIQDWCISRQIWWGHRIPAWYKDGQMQVCLLSPGDGWVQDEDVLDTWFSSALWPFSTLGWPNVEDELYKRYYPTNLMITGYDIIFFWVARMVFQGLEFTGKDPFSQTFIHGLLRASDGRKMSKSLGNGVDPIDVIEKHGADALRYFLVTNSAPGYDLRYDETKIESAWNFINKLWNISRFISLNVDDYSTDYDVNKLSVFDKWILTKLSQTIKALDYNFEKYDLMEGLKHLYEFIWDDFASWYLEISKVYLSDVTYKQNTQKVLLFVLKNILKLLHPVIPFVTEEIYSNISEEKSIMISDWPDFIYEDLNLEGVNSFIEVITKVRNLRAQYHIPQSKKLEFVLVAISHEQEVQIENAYHLYVKFLNASALGVSQIIPTGDYILLPGSINTYVSLEGLVDKRKEKDDLRKQKFFLESEIERSEKMLNNPNFIAKAPKEKIADEKSKLANNLVQLEIVMEKLKNV